MKEFGFRRVQIFGRSIGRERTPAESNNTPAQILDREHDAIAKAVVGNGNALAMHDKATRLDLLARHAFASQKLLQGIARFRRIANAERLLRRGRKSAIPQIGARLGADATLQLIFKNCAASSITS